MSRASRRNSDNDDDVESNLVELSQFDGDQSLVLKPVLLKHQPVKHRINDNIPTQGVFPHYPYSKKIQYPTNHLKFLPNDWLTTTPTK